MSILCVDDCRLRVPWCLYLDVEGDSHLEAFCVLMTADRGFRGLYNLDVEEYWHL